MFDNNRFQKLGLYFLFYCLWFERPLDICEKTADEITLLLKAMADIELLISFDFI